MVGKKFLLVQYFLGMAAAAGILFFLAAGLAEQFKQLIIVMNDRQVEKTAKDWLLFTVLTLPAGGLWAGLWLWFKGCEKKFLEVWFAQEP